MDIVTRDQPLVAAESKQPTGGEARPLPGLAKPISAGGSWVDLDRALHGLEGRATWGVSPTAILVAFADWWSQLANAPFRQLELARSAARQWRRLYDAPGGNQVIDAAANDHRFQAKAWHEPPCNAIHQAFLLAEEWWGQVSDGGPCNGSA